MPVTLARKRLIAAMVDPTTTTIKDAAERAGMTRQGAHAALSNVDVTREIARIERRQSDKARGEVAASARIRRKIQRALDKLDLDGLDPIETIAVAHQGLRIEELELAIKARYPDLNSPQDGLDAVDAHTQRCIKLGKYLKTRELRGTRP